jgi:predicted metal-dependent hydrolase
MRPSAVPEIPKRRPVLGLPSAAVNGRWFGGKRFPSTMGDALSLLFPEGERFFVESVRHYLPDLRDPRLRAEVEAFIAQEAAHGRAHRAFNQQLRDGAQPIAAELEREVRALLDLVRRVFSPMSQLAITCALEHFTALLAEHLMREADHREAIDPAVRPLWLWHALEESEHKSVAFDVYQAAGGGYVRRVLIMLATTTVFFAVTHRFQQRLLDASGGPLTPEERREAFEHVWGPRGVLRAQLESWLTYFRPGFHPTDHDSAELIAWCRTHLFGPGGPLAHGADDDAAVAA